MTMATLMKEKHWFWWGWVAFSVVQSITMMAGSMAACQQTRCWLHLDMQAIGSRVHHWEQFEHRGPSKSTPKVTHFLQECHTSQRWYSFGGPFPFKPSHGYRSKVAVVVPGFLDCLVGLERHQKQWGLRSEMEDLQLFPHTSWVVNLLNVFLKSYS